MKISVVMATYNGKAYIKQQLDSILNQTVLPDEIIICDDASTDGTIEILQEYEKKYSSVVKLIRNQENLGYSKNFWKALGYATGEIVLLSDQDDIWKNNKIEIMKLLFEKHIQIKSLSTAYELIDSHGVIYRDIRNVIFHNNRRLRRITWKEFIRHPKFPGMSMAIRREYFKDLIEMQYEEMPPHDWLLNQSAAFCGGMYFYDKILTQYRQHDSNVVGSSANSEKQDFKKRRVETICSLKSSLKFLLQHNNVCNKDYINKNIQLCSKRIKYLIEEKIVELVLVDIRNCRYISLRSILGDIYYGLRIKGTKGDKHGSYYDGDL